MMMPGTRPPLYTPRFLATCAITFLGFGQNFLLQPILPLLVIDRGGDATMVGLVFAVFSIPSIVLRPHIGRLADRRGPAHVLLAGSAAMGLLAPVYLVPSLLVLLALRVAHGVAWGAFTIGATSVMARSAPAARRGEASSVFDVMPGLASLVMPAAGLLLLDAGGFEPVFVLATALGAVAVLVAVPVFGRDDAQPLGRATGEGHQRYLERSAIFQMLVMVLFTSAGSLFLVYPPLLAVDRGIAVSDLAIYYPVYGIVLVIARAAAGRILDRVSRSTALLAAAAIALVGLVLTGIADSLALLAAGGMLFAIAYGVATPAALASAIDRAHPDRLGAAMATFTIGFQVGNGLGAALWGFLLGPLGFTVVFGVAAVIQGVLLAATLVNRSSLDGGSADESARDDATPPERRVGPESGGGSSEP